MSRLHVIVGLSLALPATLAQNYAVANMRSAKGGSSISGTVTFEQSVDDARGDMTVTYSITGLPSDGLKGFHVHQYGDTRFTETLKTMDAHFVPFCTTEFVCNDGTTTCSEGSDEGRYCCPKVSPEVGCEDDDKHGLPPSAQRQPGDMGNINVVDGVAAATLILGQKKMSLTDPTRSIVGRVVVVHSNEDDGSQPYGAAGAPMAYGVIGLGNPTTMAVPRTVNVARAPSVPKADKLACTFETSSVSKIYGDALLTLQEPCDPGSCTARMQAKLSGMTAGASHSFHFHTWGDMTVDITQAGKLGEIYHSQGIEVSEIEVLASGEAQYDVTFDIGDNGDDLLQHVGRSLTVHEGPDKSTPTVAAAACGLANPLSTLETTSKSSSSKSGLSTGVVALTVISALMFTVFLVIGGLFFFRKPIPLCGKFIYGPDSEFVSVPAPPPRPGFVRSPSVPPPPRDSPPDKV